MLEFDPLVENYCEQPVWAVAEIDGHTCRSRLDFGVIMKSGEWWYEEVKYEADLADPDSDAHKQIKIQKIWCVARNVKHRVVTEKIIWANPVLQNSLRTLSHQLDIRYIKLISVATTWLDVVLDQVRRFPRIAIREVMAQRPQHVRRDIYHLAVLELIRCGHLDADLSNVRLSPHSQLKLGDKQNYETTYKY